MAHTKTRGSAKINWSNCYVTQTSVMMLSKSLDAKWRVPPL